MLELRGASQPIGLCTVYVLLNPLFAQCTCRYTGKLPDASPEELLKMIRLADQYQVTRFMAAASSSFEALPLANITPGVMLQVR